MSLGRSPSNYDEDSPSHSIDESGSQRFKPWNVRFIKTPAGILNLEAGAQEGVKDQDDRLTEDQEQNGGNESVFQEIWIEAEENISDGEVDHLTTEAENNHHYVSLVRLSTCPQSITLGWTYSNNENRTGRHLSSMQSTLRKKRTIMKMRAALDGNKTSDLRQP